MPGNGTLWKSMTFSGMGIVVAYEVSLALAFTGPQIFVTITSYLAVFLMPSILIFIAGLIGWAAQLGRKGRALMALFSLLPLPLFFVGVRIAAQTCSKCGVHGFFFGLLASLPVFVGSGMLVVVSVILAIMAVAARQPNHSTLTR
jgi:hypothetical protein